MPDNVFEKRVLQLNDRPVDPNAHCIVYWMQRSQRCRDNLALKFAVDLANGLDRPVLVYFGLFDRYPMASVRAFQFMLEGLKETASELAAEGIGFLLRREHPAEGVARAAEELKACAVVVDEDYLNVGRDWRAAAARRLSARLYQVDAETIVPARNADREEWGAYTIRPKIIRALDQWLTEIPQSKAGRRWTAPVDGIDLSRSDPAELASSLDVDQRVEPTPSFTGGARQARARLQTFAEHGLPRYAAERNEIGVSVTSDLSPYLHFGQISSLRVGLTIGSADAPDECVDAFLEQLIVRRELAINLCLFNHRYDSLDGAADWALKTLDEHRTDARPDIYTIDELETARTHDDLWNAAQTELVRYGKIHSYMRMVWAKKLLEWLPSPEDALACAIYLNDKYALDGRDSNGYANIAWCISGKHDRPFPERPVFGRVRYMSTAATKSKTRWRDYVNRVRSLQRSRNSGPNGQLEQSRVDAHEPRGRESRRTR